MIRDHDFSELTDEHVYTQDGDQLDSEFFSTTIPKDLPSRQWLATISKWIFMKEPCDLLEEPNVEQWSVGVDKVEDKYLRGQRILIVTFGSVIFWKRLIHPLFVIISSELLNQYSILIIITNNNNNNNIMLIITATHPNLWVWQQLSSKAYS